MKVHLMPPTYQWRGCQRPGLIVGQSRTVLCSTHLRIARQIGTTGSIPVGYHVEVVCDVCFAMATFSLNGHDYCRDHQRWSQSIESSQTVEVETRQHGPVLPPTVQSTPVLPPPPQPTPPPRGPPPPREFHAVQARQETCIHPGCPQPAIVTGGLCLAHLGADMLAESKTEEAVQAAMVSEAARDTDNPWCSISGCFRRASTRAAGSVCSFHLGEAVLNEPSPTTESNVGLTPRLIDMEEDP